MTRDSWTDDKLDALNEKVDLRFDHVDERLNRLEVQGETQRSEIKQGFAAISARFDRMDEKFDARFDALDEKFDRKFAAMDEKVDATSSTVDARLDSFHQLLVYVLISVPALLVAAEGVVLALTK